MVCEGMAPAEDVQSAIDTLPEFGGHLSSCGVARTENRNSRFARFRILREKASDNVKNSGLLR
jgi:hypothetical protein